MSKRKSFWDDKVERRFQQRPVLASILAGLILLLGSMLPPPYRWVASGIGFTLVTVAFVFMPERP